MKKVLTLLPALALLAVACGEMATTAPDLMEPEVTMASSTLPNSLEWDGQGSDSDRCDKVGEGEEGQRPPTGWMHWVAGGATGVTAAELVLSGSGSGTYEHEGLGGSVQFFTPYFEIFDNGNRTLFAKLHYAGSAPSNFVLSDYCAGVEERSLEVNKTAFTEFTRTHLWDIDKKVETEEEHELDGYPKIWLYADGSGDEKATWTVDVTYEGYEDSDFVVYGEITIKNISDPEADKVINAVEDELDGTPITVDCGVTFPYTLPAGETLTCSYSVEFAEGDAEAGDSGVNMVNVFVEDDPFSPYDATDDWEFDEPTTELYASVTIEDDSELFGEVELGTVTAPEDAQFTYYKDFAFEDCEACGSFQYDNTATIVETGQYAKATLKVNVICEELTVTKTAETSYSRGHFWDIDKGVETENGYLLDDVAKVWLYIDGTGDEKATWTVDVTYEGYEDSDYNVSGEITIENTGALDAVITSVEDVLGGTPITVDCGVTFPYTLEVGETLTCYYDEDGYVEGFNEVTVTTERDEYSADAEIIWGDPTTQVNETVNIKDISGLFGEVDLGTVTAPYDAQFTYYKDFAWADYGADGCGSFQYDNTATIVETGQYAEATLKVNVQCFVYETAYAWDDEEPGICFIPTFSNWGWTNPIEPGEYEWDLWAGAAHCDTEKGIWVGTVTVEYGEDGSLEVTFNVDSPYFLEEYHVYAGTTEFPQMRQGPRTVYTVAPGQYYIEDDLEGDIYVIVHAVVGMPDPDFDPEG